MNSWGIGQMAFGTFEILAGDFLAGNHHQYVGGKVLLKHKGKFLREKIELSDIAGLEIASEATVRKLGGTVGWGIAGAIVAGPLGAIAAGILGGKKNQKTFVCRLKDGRKFVGLMPASLYSKFSAPFLLSGGIAQID